MATSRAKLGPERATNLGSNLALSTSRISSDIRIRVTFSTPFVALMITAVGVSRSRMLATTSRIAWEGTAMIAKSAASIASAIEVVARMATGSSNSER